MRFVTEAYAAMKHTAQSLERQLAGLSWVARTPSAWQDLVESPPVVVFLAPPLDTIPSAQGNAIYVLVERLAAASPVPCVVLARSMPSDMPLDDRISSRVL